MAQEPFVSSEQRPELTVDVNTRVGDLTVRQLSEILGSASSAAKSKELPLTAKDIKEPVKEDKDIKDHKDSKEHKDPKEHKDQKDNKDHKDPKDQKDQKDQKDPKDPKDTKDPKDHKEPKDTKDHKDIKDRKEDLKDHKEPKEPVDAAPSIRGAEGGATAPSGLEDIIQRIARLEQDVAGLASRSAASEQRGRRSE